MTGSRLFSSGVQARALDELHHDVLQSVGGPAELERLDHARVLQIDGDFTFGRFLESLEAGLEVLHLLVVGDLQSDDLVVLAIPSHVELGHRARNGFAQDLKPLADIDPVTLEHGLRIDRIGP